MLIFSTICSGLLGVLYYNYLFLLIFLIYGWLGCTLLRDVTRQHLALPRRHRSITTAYTRAFSSGEALRMNSENRDDDSAWVFILTMGRSL